MPRDTEGRSVRVEIDGAEVTVRLKPDPATASQLPQPEWLAFSQSELKILGLLLGHAALSREAIAAKLGESADGKVKSVLATLTGRKVILVTADGYQVNAPAVRRKALKAWVEMMGSGGEESGNTSIPA